MKKTIACLLFLSCTITAFSQGKNPDYISENLAILGIRAEKVIGSFYARQIIAKDFKTMDNSVVEGFSIGDDSFIDNGKGNDKIANDGTYTSINIYETKAEKDDMVVLCTQVIVSEHFKFESKLDRYLAENGRTRKFGSRVKCEVSSCSCTECTCASCNYEWGQTLNWCLSLKNCRIETEFEW